MLPRGEIRGGQGYRIRPVLDFTALLRSNRFWVSSTNLQCFPPDVWPAAPASNRHPPVRHNPQLPRELLRAGRGTADPPKISTGFRTIWGMPGPPRRQNYLVGDTCVERGPVFGERRGIHAASDRGLIRESARFGFSRTWTFCQGWSKIGTHSLPPYIARPGSPSTVKRYQTVYAERQEDLPRAPPRVSIHPRDPGCSAFGSAASKTLNITLQRGPGNSSNPYGLRARGRKHKLPLRVLFHYGEAGPNIRYGTQTILGRVVGPLGTTHSQALEATRPARNPAQTSQGGQSEADIASIPGYDFRSRQRVAHQLPLAANSTAAHAG